MCLPSVRAITCIVMENCCHWITAEYVYLLSEQYIIDMENCVTEILQNVSLKECRMCLPSVRAIHVVGELHHGDLHLWNTAECVYLLPGQCAVMENASLEYCTMCSLSARAINAVLENVTGILHNVFTFCKCNICIQD